MRQCLRIWANSSARVAAPRQSRPGSATTRIAPTEPRAPSALRPPHAARVPVPRVAAATGPWLARIAPYASLFRRMREKGPLPGNICAKCMLFEIKMARSSPYASISGRNRAIRDAWRANLAIKAPFSRRGPGNHAWREDAATAARPFEAPRRGSRARELAERALRPAARAWSACRMRGSPSSRPPRRYSRPGPAAPPPLRCPCPRTPPAPIAPPAGPPAPHRPAARAPPRFPQFPRNSAVIQLPIQENSVSKDKQ